MLALVLLALVLSGSARVTATVDLALVLAVDTSYSVDDGEYVLQMRGLAEAFRNPDVIDAIGRGPLGRMEVAVIEWSGSSTQRVVVPWMLVDGERAASLLALEILSAPRIPAGGGTSQSGAINASVALHLVAPYRAERRVIDVSSDGINNSGGPPELARNAAVNLSITINALAILTEVPYLKAYFERKLIGGRGSFADAADNYEAYQQAILRKLLREIVQSVS